MVYKQKGNINFGEGTGSAPNKISKKALKTGAKFVGKRLAGLASGPVGWGLTALDLASYLLKEPDREIVRERVSKDDPRNKDKDKKKELSEEEKRERHNKAMKNKKSTL